MSCASPVRITTSAIVIVVASVIANGQAMPQRSVAETFPPGEGSSLVKTRCLECHGAELTIQQRLSVDGWSREIDKMRAWGARIDDTEKPVLARYLAANFPGRGDGAGATLTTEKGADVLKTRCMTCHDATLIEQQRLGADAWSREVDKMIGWGAVLTADEKLVLVEYLSSRFR